MKEGWKYVKLGELTTSINGLWKGKKEPFIKVGVIRNANFTKDFTLDYSNVEYLDVEERQFRTRKLQKGDLIVEKSGGSEKQPVGRTIIFDKEEGEFSFSNFTSVLRIKDKNSLLYKFLYKYMLYVYFRGDTKEMQKATTGIHNIEYDKFLNIYVPVISVLEQQQIVDFLDAEFAKIDELKKQTEQSLQNAKDLFQAALKEMLTPKEGWKEEPLGTLGESKVGPFGSLLHKKDYIENGTPLINPMHIGNGKIIPDSYFSVSEEKLQELQSFVMLENDIVIGRRGEMGRCAVVTKAEEGFVCGTGSIYFRPNTKKVLPLFLQLYLSSDLGKTKLEKVAGGATMLNLSSKGLNGLIISIPTIETQIDIIDNLNNLKIKVNSLQSNYTRTIQLCADLKQALLRQVFE